MIQYLQNLIKEIRSPIGESSVYFIAKSGLLFMIVGGIVVLLTGIYPIFEHFYPPSDSGFCDVCLVVLLINIFTTVFLIMSFVFLCLRLYYSLWKKRRGGAALLIQIFVAMILFITFMEISLLPARVVTHKSQLLVGIANLFALTGTLWSGLITYKLMKIVNDNLNMVIDKR